MLCKAGELGRIVILCALAGCAGSGLADEPGPDVVTGTDVEVFQLVFGDVSRWRFPYNGRLLFAGDGDEVLVLPTTPGFPPFVPDDEWKGSDCRTWPGIGDLAASMCARNAIPAQLPFFAFEGGEVRDFGRMRTGEFLLHDPDPGLARYYVQTFLPAYSGDGRTALVRFSIAPSPHGAMCTYLLSRSDAGWWVLGRDVAYYK